MFSNVNPKPIRDIEWGWVRRYTTSAGWVVKDPLGFIRMPNLDDYFDWGQFEVREPMKTEVDWRPDEGLTLGTRNLKSVFTTAARFLGYETLLLEMPDLSEIANGFIEWNEKLLNLWGGKMDYFMIGDDYASSSGLMMSPMLWREWIGPHIEELIDLAKGYDLQVIFHSDGDFHELLPDLCGMGVDVINYERVGKMAQFETGDFWQGVEFWENDIPLKNERTV